jgi:hypothetical protein
MPRVNLIGASNRQTNSTCVFGSMAGLAPTSTVRPNITGIHGYKYARTAANGIDWNSGAILSRDAEGLSKGCGFNRGCTNGNLCVKFITPAPTGVAYYTGSKLLA